MTNLQHLAIAIALQCFIGLVADNWWAGAALAAGVFIGREHAQAEYRWIEQFGEHKRANMNPWDALEPKMWDFHSWFWNLSLPILAVLAIAGTTQWL
jgi:hypothetical protein